MSVRSWKDITPQEASTLTKEQLEDVDRPTNSMGETCPWPWEPQQLLGAPLGQYHCSYCGEMEIAGVPHSDYRDMPDDPAPPVGDETDEEPFEGV